MIPNKRKKLKMKNAKQRTVVMKEKQKRKEGESSELPIQSREISSSSPFPLCNNHVQKCFPTCRKSYRENASDQNPEHELNSKPCPKNHKREHESTSKKPLLILLGIFFAALTLILWIYQSFPELNSEEMKHMKIPFSIQDAKNLAIVLDKYKEDHFYHVYFGVCLLYVFLQSFAIPGSLFLSILSGFLFNFGLAMILVSTCSATGASLCFLISHIVGKRIVYKYFPERAGSWALTVDKHRDNLINYVIFLRITPLVPNWFINLTAPVIGVPLFPFAFGTFVGVMPPSFVAIQAGQTLHTMSASDVPISWLSMVTLIVFGVVALIPIYFKEKLKRKFD